MNKTVTSLRFCTWVCSPNWHVCCLHCCMCSVRGITHLQREILADNAEQLQVGVYDVLERRHVQLHRLGHAARLLQPRQLPLRRTQALRPKRIHERRRHWHCGAVQRVRTAVAAAPRRTSVMLAMAVPFRYGCSNWMAVACVHVDVGGRERGACV